MHLTFLVQAGLQRSCKALPSQSFQGARIRSWKPAAAGSYRSACMHAIGKHVTLHAQEYVQYCLVQTSSQF